MKPDNVVMNLKPLKLAIIDFDRTIPMATTSVGTVLGTPAYYPEDVNWRDGS
jgi:hypothetical protein